MATKQDYSVIRQEYITSALSARELARRHGLSNGTLSARIRAENWDDHRQAYRDSVTRRAYERTADKYAAEQAEIHDESIIVARATLRAYAEQLRDGKVTVTTKDAMLAIGVLRTLMGEPSTISEARTIEFSTGGLDGESLRRLLEVARAKLIDGGVATDPGLLTEGTLPN